MDTILTVKNEHLAILGPADAVDLFRELLWAEAARIGIPFDKINVSSWITVPDGGVDASVREVSTLESSNFIRSCQNAYQIKTGTTFAPWREFQIKKELFGDKPPSKESLGSSIRESLDKGGTYVLVCFGQDLVESLYKKAVAHLTSLLQQCGYENPIVDVWGQNTIISFLRPFPALALRVNRHQLGRFETYEEWMSHDQMRTEFIAGEQQEELVSDLRDVLRSDERPVHARVWGEAGIGKTRLVLEATGAEDLRPLVVYCLANSFRDSDLMIELLRGDFSAILILDECDPDTRAYIWNKFWSHSPRIKIVSIYNEWDDASGISFFDLPPLQEAQISTIIQGYNVPRDQSDRWARECSGSPRVAHVIGANLINNPEDILRPPGTIDIWERYIVGIDDRDSQEVRQRRIVLRHIALFKRFGYGRPLVDEAKAVSEFVRQADPQITWRGFQDIVATLRNRKILQGDTTLYITPKLLHIKLWIDWWDTYGEGFSVEDITTLPPSLVTWFLEMFEYARGSPAALRTASHLLGPDGLFQKNPELLSKGVGPRFFRFLAKADPEGALRCLNNTIGTWDREQLLQFESGRREAVWALQDIARWGHLFRDAAELLLALGEAENETWANNASGVFVDLFVISEHRVFNQTEASPQERFSVIKRALESDSAERRALALRACDRALQRVTVGTVRDSTQIVGPQPEIWVPSTYKELLDAYREVWQYLFSKLDTLSEDDKLKVVEILLRNARSLAWLGNLSSMIINTITELSQKTYIDKEEVLKVVTQVLHYDGPNLPEEVREKWMDLKNSLIGKDFSSLLERYVRMDIFEDQFDEDGNLVDQTQEPIRNLAQQAIENESLLHSELDWLVTTKAQKGYQFGYELGKLDRSSSLLPEITEAQKNADQNSSLYFFGGYLRAVFEQAPQEWESLMDTFVQDEKSKNWVPELTWRLGKLSDKSAVRVLDLMEEGITDLGHFRMFIYGGILQDLTEDIFIRWMEFIISQSDTYASYIALALFSHYYLAGNSQQKPPKNLMLKVLTNPELFKKSDIARKDQMVSYYWAKIGKTFVRLYPERSLDLGDVILSNLGTSGTILEGFDTDPYSVLSEILQRFPEETWKRIAEHLIPPRDRCAFFLEKWLRGEDHWKKEEAGALSLVPPRIIWDWASEDIENRAWYLASFVPKLLVCEEDQVCWAREVLVRYGEREDVRRNLAANFSTEGWWGPESLYLAEKRDQLLTFKENEDNENVRVWIDEYVLQLEQRIEQARIMEERDEFL